MENFKDYFIGTPRLFLENISYETVKAQHSEGSRKLGVRDTLVGQLLMPSGIKMVFNRRMSFEPEGNFTLSVSFGVFLHFNSEVRDLVDWQKVNLVEEFTKNFPMILAEMSSRTSLLTAQITSASGGAPVIIPQIK